MACSRAYNQRELAYLLKLYCLCIISSNVSCDTSRKDRRAYPIGVVAAPPTAVPPRAPPFEQLFSDEAEGEGGEEDVYDDQELALRESAGVGGPTELLLELDDWVQFRVRNGGVV